MFHFVPGKSIGEGRLIDEERHAEFRDVSGMGRSNVTAALLTAGKRVIPLEYADVSRIDPATGKKYELIGFVQIGSSKKVLEVAGIGSYEFRSPEEREEVRLLAIEAVLAHLYRFVEGSWDIDGVRVVSEGREWKASDFGYYSSPSRSGGAR